MKTRHKGIMIAVFMTAALILIRTLPSNSLPDGSVPAQDIVSYCVGDVTGDGIFVLLAITGGIETGEENGEPCGNSMIVCEPSAETDISELGYIPPEKIQHHIELTGLNPMKIQLGDVNGDGIAEVAICVYKTAKFHPVMDKRPFFFQLVDGNLIPIWLGSRLSRPFDDFILYDIDHNTIDEIIAIERLENGNRVFAAYNWRGFGFEMLAQSDEFDNELHFGQDETQDFRIYEGSIIYNQ